MTGWARSHLYSRSGSGSDMNEAPKPGSTWTPTKDAETTFPRHVLAIKKNPNSPAYDRVVFRRVLKDGGLGLAQSCYVDAWRSWVRQFDAVQADAPKDNTEALRAALTNARAFVARRLDDVAAVACLREIDAALGEV